MVGARGPGIDVTLFHHEALHPAQGQITSQPQPRNPPPDYQNLRLYSRPASVHANRIRSWISKSSATEGRVTFAALAKHALRTPPHK